ncbi:MAG: methionyl aminopeptidase [Lachnospiraceae bacterium]|nr:methionyl aminopeptidase [Lachnospiraceae bacterium]
MTMKIGRNDPCWCESGRKYKQCHEQMDRKIEGYRLEGHIVPTHDIIKNPEQIQGIRDSAKINIACLDEVGKNIKVGMCLKEIDDIVNRVTKEMGGIPAPLNYEGFPYSVCTSVNDQVCHGYPHEDVFLEDGDIVNVDCSTILNGYYSDSSRMFMVGNVSKEDQDLVRVTKECCDLALAEVKPWAFMGNLGDVVMKHATANGYTVVREIGGHGCGLEFHEEPWIGYHTARDTEMLLVPGMTFTIEPMVNAGSERIHTDQENGWEVYTLDGAKSAQWEYQVLVTEDGYEILSY